MQMSSSLIKTTLSAALSTALLASALQVQAGPHEPAQTPLFASQSAPPLNMLVLGRDHTLYSPAYDNASDLDGDGVIDVGYKGHLPKDQGGLDYFGYFDSYKCYSYGSNVFTPHSTTDDKTCSGSYWSGDYLNYLTTSRMDALRKVLYGGYRRTDDAATSSNASKTILERVYIRQDAHTWGSEYTSQAIDGYNIKDYTEFDAPGNNRRILFASTNTSLNGAPQLRVRSNSNNRIWDWVAAEVTQAANPSDKDFTVRVEVCKEGLLEDNCTQYEGRNYKPTGLLHDFGESDDMYFGLLTGSYTNNLQGGVLRKAISSFRDEIDLRSGVFSSTKGIVETLNTLRIDDANNSGSYQDCTTGNTLDNGSCRNWGNPLGEMMFEALRYLSGASSPTQGYSYTGNNDKGLTLPKASWSDPYADGGLGAQCSRPFMTVISDVNPSYDSTLPGNSFGESAPATTSALSSMNVSSLGQTIWNTDVGTGSKQINIGQVGTATSDYAPTAKSASSFGNIRGLPDEPTKLGTYYSASVAYYANTHPLTSKGDQPVKTYAVALSSPLPQIRMPVGDGEITLVPFGKVVTGNPDVTMQITGFFVDSMVNMRGQPVDNSTNGGRPQAIFRVVFDDAAQGADYDMDAVVEYKVSVTANDQLEVILQRLYANAGYESHMGYTLAGAGDADGIYLEVSGGRNNGYTKYRFDTPRGRIPGDCNPTSKSTCNRNLITSDNTPTEPRYFAPGSGATTSLENPLWYAAKWGGFGNFDNTSSSRPVDGQWDSKQAGTPDNYFLVTNAGNLQEQLTAAFRSLADSVGSVTSPAVRPDGNTASDSEFSVYRTDYQVSNWSGNLLKERIDAATGEREILWEAANQMTASRNIKMANADGDGLINFEWSGLNNRYHGNTHLQAALASDAEGNPAPLRANGTLNASNRTLGQARLNEAKSRKLRDIINSSPVVVEGAQYLHYLANRIEPGSDYGAFAADIAERKSLVYVGSNGGMLHAFDTDTGAEHFAFVPTAVIPNLYRLSSPDYSQAGGEHHFFVDGTPVVRDVYIKEKGWRTVLVGTLRAGGRSLFALDITAPDNPDNIDLLWEFNLGDDLKQNEEGASDLGYSFPTPTIARLHSGQWAVITGNGYDSDGRRAALLLIDIATGELIRKLPVGTDQDFGNDINGLSSVRVADNNSDGIADYVYAGDLQGNLWRFDLINTNDPTPLNPSGTVVPDHFAVSFGGSPLYTARNSNDERQPITAPPSLVRHPSMEGYIVMFGTGRYFQTIDKETNRLDSVYGIWDKQTAGESAATTPNLSRDNLVAQSFTEEKQLTFNNDGSTTTATVRMLSDNPIDWSSKYGWVLNLEGDNGERIIDEMAARGQVLLLTSRTPVDSDPCAPGLMGWTYGINPYSGGRTAFNVFDFNQSGSVGVDDSDNGNVVSGFQTPAGGLTLSGDTLFGTDGSTIKVDYGAISTGRQSWQVIPEGE